MGSCTSKSEVNQNQPDLGAEIQLLKEQIQSLMQKEARVVNSEMITKDEFNLLKQKFEKLEEDVEKKVSMKYNQMLFDKDAQINELAKQVESLKSINSGLELKIKNMIVDPTNPVSNKINELSKAKIDEFVEKLLNDTNVNIKYLPDFVERAIYKNVLNLIIGLLNNTLNTVSIKFLGHQLTFDIMPDQSEVTVETRELTGNSEGTLTPPTTPSNENNDGSIEDVQDIDQRINQELVLEELLEKEINEFIDQSIKND